MSRRSLVSLAIGALDQFSRIENLQDVLTICLKEIDDPSVNKTQLRIEMLSLYRGEMLVRLDEIRFEREGLFELARIMAAQIQQQQEENG